jgi:mono/diheme cytochrome c family protein
MRFLAGFLSALVLAAVLAIAAVETGTVPANADRGPLMGEKWAAGTSLDATLRREAPKASPFEPTAADLANGAKLYVQNCAVCHGTAHSTSNAIARGLYIRAPQFNRRKGVTDDPVGETYWKIAHGIAWTAMPAFRTALGEREVWQIAWFLKNRDRLSGDAKAAWNDPKLVPPPTPMPTPSVAATPALK